MQRYLFPKWSNKAPALLFFAVLGPLATALVAALWYYGTNKHLEVGYQPVQPVDYSHKLHAGDLGMDCRYCHSTVERASFAALPATQTCMNCHSKVRVDSPKLTKVHESFSYDKPIEWVRVHKLPEYVYFDHSAHLAAGVGCSSCHGRVDQMHRVMQVQPLSMSWCLECHRNPGPNLRPASELTNMAWQPASARQAAASGAAGAVQQAVATGPSGAVAPNGRVVNPPTNCSGCHR